jgi:hypothetical protein
MPPLVRLINFHDKFQSALFDGIDNKGANCLSVRLDGYFPGNAIKINGTSDHPVDASLVAWCFAAFHCIEQQVDLFSPINVFLYNHPYHLLTQLIPESGTVSVIFDQISTLSRAVLKRKNSSWVSKLPLCS